MQYVSLRRCTRAFTLIEVLVVIGIISTIALGILTVVYNARKEARDMIRISDIQQLQLGVRLYKEAYGNFPSYPSGALIDTVKPVSGSDIDKDLALFVPKAHVDPLGAVSPYGYWYDSSFNCTVVAQRVLLVRKMEMTSNANFDAVCGAGNPSDLPLGWNRSEVFVALLD